MALTKVTEKVITDNLNISGIASASNFKTGTTDVHSVGVTAGLLVVGSAVTSNSDGIDVTGIVTATSFVGSGANLTGIDATSIKHSDGNVKIQAINTGANVTGNLSVSGNLGIAGVLTYEDVTNVDSIGIITARSTVSIADSIVHTGDTNTSIRFPAADTITAETAGLERLRISSTGTVAFKGAGGTEQVKIESQGGGTGIFIANYQGVDAGDSTRIGVGKNDNALIFTNASGSQIGAFAIGNTDAIPLVLSTNNSERLRITGAGAVGIGISTPDQKLHVYEQSGSSQAYLHIQNNRARNAAVKFTTTQGSWLLGQGIGADVDRLMVYDTQERLSIDSNGDVVIGTTSWNYKKPLNVQGSSGAIISIFNGDTTTYAANTNASLEFKLKTGSSTNQETACEIRGFKENGTDGNSARGLSFYTGESGVSPAERLRITSFGDVYSTNSAYNTYDTAATSVETVTQNNQNRPGVYWLNFNGVKFRAYVKPNWLQGRNWVLAAKYFDPQDMTSGSSLWTNDTYVNESDFNLYGGLMSKYRSWRYFSFNRLAMQMGNRIPPIMQFNSNQTLYGAFSGGRASNGGGVTANSTDPPMSGTTMTYHSMDNYAGPDFHDTVGSEDRLGSYGLNKWANNAANSTSAVNQGSVNANSSQWDDYNSGAPTLFNHNANHSLDYRALKGFRLTVEDSVSISGLFSNGYAGAWIGCPLDEGNSTQGSNGSNVGADSGFGLGGSAGNPARTWTSGYAEWGQGNYVVNCLPAYIWLSID